MSISDLGWEIDSSANCDPTARSGAASGGDSKEEGMRDVAPPARADTGQLLELVTAIFQHWGMSKADTAPLDDSLVAADLRGDNSHGLLRVLDFFRKLT